MKLSAAGSRVMISDSRNMVDQGIVLIPSLIPSRRASILFGKKHCEFLYSF
jgi:hypothetical protein